MSSLRSCLVIEFSWGLVGIIPTKPQIPTYFKKIFGIRILSEFNPVTRV
jgi:hypothetical protein